MTEQERLELLALSSQRTPPSSQPDPGDSTAQPDQATVVFSPTYRDALLEMLYASGSNLLVLPVQDVFGWTDRINVPATINDKNWTYRLPWAIDTWDQQPEAVERRDTLRGWSERYLRV